MPSIPERLQWAVSRLAVGPDDSILEIGCAGGMAMAAICRSLATGHITGIDSSAHAIAKAQARLAQELSDGKASLLQGAFADIDLPRSFKKVFAVNVNAFWVDPAANLAAVQRILAPSGTLYLFYEQPSEAQLRKAEELTVAGLEKGSFQVATTERKRLTDTEGTVVVATFAGSSKQVQWNGGGT